MGDLIHRTTIVTTWRLDLITKVRDKALALFKEIDMENLVSEIIENKYGTACFMIAGSGSQEGFEGCDNHHKQVRKLTQHIKQTKWKDKDGKSIPYNPIDYIVVRHAEGYDSYIEDNQEAEELLELAKENGEGSGLSKHRSDGELYEPPLSDTLIKVGEFESNILGREQHKDDDNLPVRTGRTYTKRIWAYCPENKDYRYQNVELPVVEGDEDCAQCGMSWYNCLCGHDG